MVSCTILPTLSFTRTDVEVVDTVATYTGRTVGSEMLERLPIQRDLAGIVRLGPNVTSQLNVPGDNYIVGNAQVPDMTGPSALIIKSVPYQGSSLRSVWSCLVPENPVTLNCRKLSTPSSFSPGLSIGSAGSIPVLNLVGKAQNNEFSQGIVLNPATALPAGARFAVFKDPERSFYPGLISSTGISDDAKVTFQLLNFPSLGGKYNTYFFLQHNNITGRPVGEYQKFQWNTGAYTSSGSLSNVLKDDDSPTPKDRIYLTYKYFENAGQPNATSQVRLKFFDANTFEQIGTTKIITPPMPSPYPALELQSVAMEPSGAFILYTRFDLSCQKYTLSLRLLNSNGSFQGGPRVVRKCQDVANYTYGITSVDIHDYLSGSPQ